MKRLVLLGVFTLCLSGAAYAQDSTDDGGNRVRVGVSISIPDGEVRVGNVRVREGNSAGSNASQKPSRDTGADSGKSGSGNGRRDPWEGTRGEPKDKGPKDSGPKDSGPKDKGPKDSGPKDSGPRESGPRGGRRDIN